jgi:hypothetical protein
MDYHAIEVHDCDASALAKLAADDADEAGEMSVESIIANASPQDTGCHFA